MSEPRADAAVPSLARQRALVTGSSSGIGAGIALALARAGADVVVNYARDEDGARRTSAEIERAGRRAVMVKADVSDERDVERLFAETLRSLGGLDILVANAGLQRDASLLDMSLEDWNRVIGVNLTGAFLCARAAAREFFRRGVDTTRSRAAGKILCISSVHDLIPWAGHANYAASKGGLLMLVKTLAQELAEKRIRVNAISPGAIKTSINRGAWETPEAERELLRLIPYGRVGEVEDVARAAVWLVSDAADYVHGTTLYVDGGMTLYPEFRGNG